MSPGGGVDYNLVVFAVAEAVVVMQGRCGDGGGDAVGVVGGVQCKSDVDGVCPAGIVVDVLDNVPDAVAGTVVVGDEQGRG